MIAPLAAAGMAWGAVGLGAAVLSLPGTVELLLVTVGNLLPARTMHARAVAGTFRLAIVVPAHNEAASVSTSVRSLLRASHPFAEASVVVVADNCTDLTAEVAASVGARVLVREDAVRRGKGYALDHAFGILVAEGYDAILIVDADTEVAPNFLEVAGSALRAGADAVQARYLVRNPEGSVRTRLMRVALLAFNVARPRGREHLGMSCGILGNGFGVRRETLLAVPYSASSVVEDLEYHLMLTKSGRKVRFLDQTTVFGEMPESGKGVAQQRSRWEGGRFRMIRERALPLAGDVLRGRLSLLEPLLELLLLPLAFHATLLLVACTAPSQPARILGLVGAAVACGHLVSAVLLGGSLRDATALLMAPFYILWKLRLVPALLRSSSKTTQWTRTERTAERRAP